MSNFTHVTVPRDSYITLYNIYMYIYVYIECGIVKSL